MKLKTKINFFFFLLLFLPSSTVFAQKENFVSIVNPVRGNETWGERKITPLQTVIVETDIANQYLLPVTWLVRSDAFEQEIAHFLKRNNKNEIGIFLEIMPLLAEKAIVTYHKGGVFWHDANKIFLSGYSQDERKRLIDTTFEAFYQTFGFYPKSVGAWHIDAFSAGYMKEKYQVSSILICSDQFGTDNYQIWGGWWGVPYYPSKYNILSPAQTSKNKLGVVVSWWAARDPRQGYYDSLYSVQINDYLKRGFDINYFDKLADYYLKNNKNLFGQLTVGLENDNDFLLYKDEFLRMMKSLSERESKGELRVVKMSDFSDWYRKTFPKLSPKHYVENWEMDVNSRIGYDFNDRNKIIDLRIYNELWSENNYINNNPWPSLSLNIPYKIDTIRFPNNLISFADLSKINLNIKIPFSFSIFPILIYYLLLILFCFVILKKRSLIFFIIVLGSIIISLSMVKNGIINEYGMPFWSANGPDGTWHIALSNQLAKFSLESPVFSGYKLQNYHIGFDLIIAVISKITTINPRILYFQVIPPLLAILIGLSTNKFIFQITKSNTKSFFVLFIIYFGGSWGWVINLFRGKIEAGESMFWSSQSQHLLVNPPFALSLVLLFIGLVYFDRFLKSNLKKDLLISAFIFGFSAFIKIYLPILMLLSVFVLILIRILFKKNIKQYVRFLFVFLIFFLIFYLPVNLKGTTLLEFKPLWFLRTMMTGSDRLYLPIFENARFAYFHSHQWLKWIILEIIIFAIFIIGNIGTRIIGLLQIYKLREYKEIFFLLTTILFFSLLLPQLFIQKGTSWNTIQFFYYFQIIIGIFAGIQLGEMILKKKTLFNLIVIIFMIISLPASILTLNKDFLNKTPSSYVNFDELEALSYLDKQEDGIILSYPYDEKLREIFYPQKPLYALNPSSYLSALSNKQTFISSETVLKVTDYKYEKRILHVRKFFITNDKLFANKLLKDNNIKYIYLIKGQKMNLGKDDISAEKIFENGEVTIYKINI